MKHNAGMSGAQIACVFCNFFAFVSLTQRNANMEHCLAEAEKNPKLKPRLLSGLRKKLCK